MSQVTGKRDELKEDIPATSPNHDLTRARRRRLLLGGVAIPTVYTLTSGAGVAAASLTCWDRQSQTTYPAPVTAGTDQWARAPMKSGGTGTGWKTMGYCMKDPTKQGECTDPLQTDWSAAQTYWYVNGQKTLEAQGGVRFIPKTPGYGLLYIDKTGTVQTFDPALYPGIELRYTAMSCWTSMYSTTKLTLG